MANADMPDAPHGDGETMKAQISCKFSLDTGFGKTIESGSEIWVGSVLQPDSMNSHKIYEEISHPNFLSCRFHHVHEGCHIAVHQKFDSTLLEYIETECKLLHEYELLPIQCSNRRQYSYVPPRYRRFLRGMISFLRYLFEKRCAIEHLCPNNLVVQEHVLKFRGLEFTKINPANEEKMKKKSFYVLSKTIEALFVHFKFARSDLPKDVDHLLKQMIEFKIGDEPYLYHHLAVLPPSERMQVIGNFRDQRFGLGQVWLEGYELAIRNMKLVNSDDWTAMFVARTDNLKPVNECFSFPGANYKGRGDLFDVRSSCLQFCGSLTHHLLHHLRQHSTPAIPITTEPNQWVSTLDVDLTLMSLFSEELLSVQRNMHEREVLQCFTADDVYKELKQECPPLFHL